MPSFALLFHKSGSSRNLTSNSVLKDITASKKKTIFTEIFGFLVQIVINIMTAHEPFLQTSFKN